jgi:outer membrane immunogenic protein
MRRVRRVLRVACGPFGVGRFGGAILSAGLLGAGLLCLSAAPAVAADMPEPPQAAPIFYAPPPFIWTGFYVGGNFGWSWTQISDTVTIAGKAGSLAGTANGFLGGGQAGFNWQVFQPLVLGIEGDFQGFQTTKRKGSVNTTVGLVSIAASENIPYFGTIRGRIGYAYGTFLFYATAGGVYGARTLAGTLSTIGSFSSSAIFTSWTAGAGIETSLGGRFSAKLEYLFIGSPSDSPPVPGETALVGTSSTNLVRFGVNYRF